MKQKQEAVYNHTFSWEIQLQEFRGQGRSSWSVFFDDMTREQIGIAQIIIRGGGRGDYYKDWNEH